MLPLSGYVNIHNSLWSST